MERFWRLLDFGQIDIYTAMAMDEAILNGVADGSSPDTIRFAQFDPPVVSLGYFQSAHDEIDLDACKRLGIGVARRLIGGGAAYEDSIGELTYGICVKLPHPRIPSDLLPSYEALSSGVIAGLRHLGVNASFAGVNDVVVRGRKIGGVGQCDVRTPCYRKGRFYSTTCPTCSKFSGFHRRRCGIRDSLTLRIG